MKKIALFLFISISFYLNNPKAQNAWQKILGGTFTDEANAVIVTQDGHLLVGGSSESFSMDDREGYIAKLTMDGTLLWEQTYNFDSFWNPVYDLIEMPNGNYMATGQTWAQVCPMAMGRSFIFEVNNAGDTLWTKGLCGDQFGLNVAAIVSTPDGGYVFCGRGGYADIGLVKTDAFGNFKWEKALVNPGWENGYNVIVTQDGNLITGAYWQETVNGNNDAYLAKLSSLTGDTLWTKVVSENGNEYIFDIVEIVDESIVAIGINDNDPQLIHFSAEGELLEKRIYFDTSMYWYRPNSIKLTPDGGFAVAGVFGDTISVENRDGFLLKLDANFDIEWYQTYGGDKEDQILDMATTPDGGYCLVGQTRSFGDENGDLWIIKTDSLGNSEIKTIKGITFVDENDNCTENLLEIEAPNVWVELTKGGENILRLTDNYGEYSSIATIGNYTLNATPPIPYWEICNNPQQAEVTNSTSEITRDFGMQATVDCPYITLDVSMPFLRLCSDGKIYGQICNNGTVPALNTQITIELDTFLTLDSASVPFIQQANNSFIFDIGDLDLFECNNFVLHIFTNCDAPFGWTHCLNASATPDTICHPDINPYYTVVQECIINVGSYDPNDKTAFPTGMGDEHIIENETEIKYQIRFQNTGTDTAFGIVIVDTLSAQLDPFSFRAGAYSHDYRLEWSEGALKFIFNPIVLPDSIVNEPASHGFVNFFIRPKADLPIGTIIENSAAIYFDSNEPVITNTWFHTVGNFISAEKPVLQGKGLKVGPNPANENLNIQVSEYYLSEVARLYDVYGRIRKEIKLASKNVSLDLSSFENGIYFLTIQKNEVAESHIIVVSE